MSVKSRMLEILEERKGTYVSGELIAEALGVTRAAVWKAAAALREQGYGIESAGRRGYRLSPGSDRLSAPAVTKNMRHKCYNIMIYENTGSTNDDAKALAERGGAEFTVIAAEKQDKGKGRLGRSFYSPKGTGIYFSIILRPKMPVGSALYITTSAAVAVSMAVDEICGAKSGIKWVNDVFVGGKKICGILTEASLDMESGTLDHAVLGIGVNVSPPEGGFPGDLNDVAACLYPDADCPPGTRSLLLGKILDNFYEFYSAFPQKLFLDEYRRRSILTGKRVNVYQGDTVFPADVIGIDDSCRLIVNDGNREITLDSGEVSVRLD